MLDYMLIHELNIDAQGYPASLNIRYYAHISCISFSGIKCIMDLLLSFTQTLY